MLGMSFCFASKAVAGVMASDTVKARLETNTRQVQRTEMNMDRKARAVEADHKARPVEQAQSKRQGQQSKRRKRGKTGEAKTEARLAQKSKR